MLGTHGQPSIFSKSSRLRWGAALAAAFGLAWLAVAGVDLAPPALADGLIDGSELPPPPPPISPDGACGDSGRSCH